MKIDYLFIGIARGDRNDFAELYRLTKKMVYAVALSHVCDKTLAKEIMTETYKRVWMYAYSYNTDMDGELWLLEIARNLSINAMMDKKIKKSSEKQLTDNLSKVIIDIILNLDNDRGKIILLSSVCDLSQKDLASFLWYKPGTFKSEYRAGIKQLESLEPFYRELDIEATIEDNFPEALPDVWDRINSDQRTELSYTSHELLDLTEEEYSFGNPEEETGKKEDNFKAAAGKEKTKRKTLLIVSVILCLLLAAGIVTAIVLSGNNNSGKKDDTSDDYYQYLNSAQYNTKLSVFYDGQSVFYSDASKDNALYSVSLSESGAAGTAVRTGDIKTRDFVVTEDKILFRSLEDGMIYSAAKDGSGVSLFSDRTGAVLEKGADCLYFSGTTGIYKIPFTGGLSELVFDCSEDENLERYDLEVSDSGRLFFSAGAWGGIHYLTEYHDEPSIDTVFLGEAYTLESENNRLYFTYLGTDGLYIYYIDESELETKSQNYIQGIKPGTGAFSVSGDSIYYEGYESDSTGIISRGLYRISAGGGDSTELFSYEIKDKMYLADVYVFGNVMFCYYSSGEKNGSLRLETRLLSNPGEVSSVLIG